MEEAGIESGRFRPGSLDERTVALPRVIVDEEAA
jgi:hypothetical protein